MVKQAFSKWPARPHRLQMTSPKGSSPLRELNIMCVTEFSATVTEMFLNSDSPIFAECEP